MNNKIKKIIVSIFAILSFVFIAPSAFASGVPVMSTNGATNITSTTVTLNGYFNGNGSNMTSVFFQYGDSPLMNSNSNSLIPVGSFGTYSDSITGLNPGTTYYFQAVGINASGFGWGTSTLTFKTLPVVPVSTTTINTNSATNITQTSATLNGYFNGGNSSTQTYLEYGTSSSSFTSQTPTVNQSSLSGSFSAPISNLSPATTYYFRAVAINSLGVVSTASALNFTTLTSFVPPSVSCSINYFNTNQNAISSGNGASLSWSTNNCSNVYLSSFGSVSISNSGYPVYPSSTTTYTLNASNGSTNDSSSVTVTVVNNNCGNNCSYPHSHQNQDRGYYQPYYYPQTSQQIYYPQTSVVDPYYTTTTSYSSGTIQPQASTSRRVTSTNNNQTGNTNVNGNTSGVNGSNLAAGAGFALGSFFPSTMLGWLMLVIFILVLIIISRVLFKNPNTNHNNHNH